MKKRNILLGIICFLMIFMLSGCKDKVAITTSDFSEKVKSKGYSVVDVTEQYAEYGSIKEGTVAINSKGFNVEFYVLDSDSYAQSMFENNKSKFESTIGTTSSHSEVNVKNYNTYTLTTNGKYMHLCRVDNTLLYIDVDETHKDEVKDLIKDLGY